MPAVFFVKKIKKRSKKILFCILIQAYCIGTQILSSAKKKGGKKMKKTMYSAMKNLAEYISASQSSDFDEIWDEWSSKYKPEDYMELPLRKMGMQLCQIDKAEIKSVPERSYRDTIKKTLKPGINKEEFENEREEQFKSARYDEAE